MDVTAFWLQWQALTAATGQHWHPRQTELVQRMAYALEHACRVDVVVRDRRVGKSTALLHVAVAWALAQPSGATLLLVELTGRQAHFSFAWLQVLLKSMRVEVRRRDRTRHQLTLVNAQGVRVRLLVRVGVPTSVDLERNVQGSLRLILVDEPWYLRPDAQRRLVALGEEAGIPSVWIGTPPHVPPAKDEVQEVNDH